MDPCAIGGKDLEKVAGGVGLSMEEVLCWFEDEKSRRAKRLSLQLAQPQQPAQQLLMSPAATTTSRTMIWSMSEFGSLLPGSAMQLDEDFPLLPIPTPPDDLISPRRTTNRGRPPKNKSLRRSVSPSPEAKRQKSLAKYPCTDCNN